MLNSSLIFPAIIVFLFLLVSLIVIGLHHSYKQDGMKGGFLLMWIAIFVFMAIVYFHNKNLKAAEPAQAHTDAAPASSRPITFPKL